MQHNRFSRTTLFMTTISLFMNACNAVPPAVTPTDTPEPASTAIPSTATATLAPTPVPGIYRNEDLGVSFSYPPEWHLEEAADHPWIEINEPGDGGARFLISIASLEKQAFGSPIATMDQYTLFSDMEMPDKERAHMVEINGKEFAIGTYSASYIESRQGQVALFMAVHYTKFNTMTIELYASTDRESQFRKVFEDMLGSIEVTQIEQTRYAISSMQPRLLVTAEELPGWMEGKQTVTSDGICREFLHDTIEGQSLHNCVFRTFVGSQFYTPPDLAGRRDEYRAYSESAFVDLGPKSRYTFEDESVIFAWQTSDGLPIFTLILQRDGLDHTAELIIPKFQDNETFEEGILQYFEAEADKLLHDVMTISLEKSEHPFDIKLLAPAAGWEITDYQSVYNDGACRQFDQADDLLNPAETNLGYWMTSCAYLATENYKLESIIQSFEGDTVVDLGSKSKYSYNHEYRLYGYLRDGSPVYDLYLERDGVLYNVDIHDFGHEAGADPEKAVVEYFSPEIDDSLYNTMMLNLKNFE